MLKGDYTDKLQRLVEIQKSVKDIYPIFNNNYPVTVVSNNTFEIYDMPEGKKEYGLSNPSPALFKYQQV